MKPLRTTLAVLETAFAGYGDVVLLFEGTVFLLLYDALHSPQEPCLRPVVMFLTVGRNYVPVRNDVLPQSAGAAFPICDDDAPWQFVRDFRTCLLMIPVVFMVNPCL